MPVTIRSRLLLLVMSVLLPGLLGTAWIIGRTFENERSANARTLHDSARALSMVVDRELTQRAALARVLALSRWLDDAPDLTPADLQKFEREAERALQGQQGWIELRASDRTLLDTRQPANAGLASAPFDHGGSGQVLVETPLVQPLQTRHGEPYAALVQPVLRDGRVVLNLVVTLRPSELQRIVDAQSLPKGWVGTVMDNRGTVVARHPGGGGYVGRSATPDLRERMKIETEGLFESVSLDGQRTTGYFSTSSQGWTYLTAMPREQFAGLVPQSVRNVAMGALLLLALAVAGALWVSRRIVAPVLALKTAAERMQSGLPVQNQPTGIKECDEVAQALAEAAESLQRGRTDLEAQVADAVARTRQAEQRVSQSQRVEALGRLTGGVAHDFNNLLGVISNSAHLIERLASGPPMQVPLAAIRRSVESGSQLTQHLLSFAGRRPVRPQPVHLPRYLPELQELMRSVLSRRIEISVQVAPDTLPVRVDPGEMELAFINLALNARDAMPSGGTLALAARNATPLDWEGPADPEGRQHVLVTVTDDGNGIEPEVMARVFEPFFTTKGVGKGTGLGLSQVHGFCTQAGGAVRLASTPGLGTTVSMLLPALREEETAEAAAPAPPPLATAVQGARVLLVEDNEQLSEVTAALLQSHRASVRRASSAAEAMRLLAAGDDDGDGDGFDVVLSDVVMPGELDGLALARRLQRERPGLPVVLISGYNTHVAPGDGFVVLRKPCPQDELLAALRDAMATGRGPARLADPSPAAGP